MPKAIVNTVVFVGREIEASVLDERNLVPFLGPLDRQQIKAGPIGQFTYSRGQSELLITPDRITLRFPDRSIFPGPFLAAARALASEIEQIRKEVHVTAVGLNCDILFYQTEIDREGTEFCYTLTNPPFSQHLLEEQEEYMAIIQFIYRSQALQYNIRFEPERRSRGRDLLMAVNGHQDVSARDTLPEKLAVAEEARDRILRFHNQVLSSRGH